MSKGKGPSAGGSRRQRRTERRTAARRQARETTAPAPAARRTLRLGETGFAALLTAAFLALVVIGVLRHELWRDEWQSWLIGRESRSWAELFRRLGDESQPPLWLSALYLLGRLTSAPLAMQLLHALLATASVWIVARFAPFRWWEKALFALGCFPLYEYGVVSRNYALGILFAWLFCLALGRARHALAALALVALAASSHQGVLIAAPMMGLLAVRWWTIQGPRGRALPVALALVAFAGVAAACAWLMSTGQVLRHNGLLQVGFDPRLLARSVTTAWNAYVPLPHLDGSGAHWNTNVLGTFNSWLRFSGHPGLLASDPLQPQELTAVVLSLALLAASTWSLARDRLVAAAVLAAQLLLLAATYGVYFGWLRHHGHLFVVFVMGTWLLRDRVGPAGTALSERLRPLLPALLAVHAVAGLSLYVTDVRRPFTSAQLVPEYLRAAGLFELPVMGSPDYLLSPIAGELERPFWSLDTRRMTTATEWKAEKRSGMNVLYSRMVQRVRVSTAEGHLLITGFPFESQLVKLQPRRRGPRLKLTPLATFGPRMVPDEAYALYYVQRKGTKVPDAIKALAIGRPFLLP